MTTILQSILSLKNLVLMTGVTSATPNASSQTALQSPRVLVAVGLLAAISLLMMFAVGLLAQRRLVAENIERVLTERAAIASNVADTMQTELEATLVSATRLALLLDRQLSVSDPAAAERYPLLVETLADGSQRSRRTQFDAATQAGIWLPKALQPDAKQREQLVQLQQFIEAYARGAEDRVFVDTWILPAFGGEVVYWPSEPEFIYAGAADFDYRDSEWHAPARPENNPDRKAYWTKMAFDPIPKIWMVSAVAPVYVGTEFLGSLGHDMPLARIIERTRRLREQAGGEFILLTKDGLVAASDVYAKAIIAANGELKLSALPDPIWQQIAQQTVRSQTGQTAQQHQRLRFSDHIAFVSHIGSQDWTLISLMPLQPLIGGIEQTFIDLRNIAIVTLLLALLIATALLYWHHARARRDVAALMATQNELSLREQQFRTLVANVPGVVCRCANDADWSMRYISPAIAELCGYPDSDFIDNKVRSFASIIHAADQAQVNDGIAVAIAAKTAFVLQYRITHRTGESRWVIERGRGIYASDGSVLYLDGVMLDQSDLHNAQEDLRAANLSLERKVEERTEALAHSLQSLESFGYAVSHDLRAPLRHAGSYLEILAETLNTADEEQATLLQRIRTAIQRMNELIQGLWSVARLGVDALHCETVALDALLDELIAEWPAPQRARVDVQRENLPMVWGDRILLRQVLQNILDNALKYSAQRAQSRIQIQPLPAGNAEHIVIMITDNGIGFDNQYSKRMFELFQRLHAGQDYAGSGVGLALCARIIALHQGRIWAEGEIDKGARVFIELPRPK